MKKYLFLPLLFVPHILFATAYHVGPAQTYLNISDVPLELLEAGDTVYIHYREQPYKEKFVIGATGTESTPVVIFGVPSNEGELPVIDGDNAQTRTELDFWSEMRGIIKIGGTSYPEDKAAWVVVENLEIKNARPGFSFYDDNGVEQNYSKNAAAIYIEKGENITVRNCKIHDCGNGLFCAYQGKNINIEFCEIYNNGIEGSIFEHNSYTEADGVVFQFNKYGKLRDGCLGNNLKDRSAGTVIRYNWIEGGSRQLDLVESDHSEIYNQETYRSTYVYNNVLLEFDNEGNRQICHYGGDGGDASAYRKGTLYLYNNTVVSTRTGRNTLLRLSSGEEKADVRNNVVYTSSGGENLEIVTNSGTVDLFNNWISSGWVNSFESNVTVNEHEGNLTGSDPGFVNVEEKDYRIAEGSELIGNSGNMNENIPQQFYPEYSFTSDAPTFEPRNDFEDIGAYRFSSSTKIVGLKKVNFNIFPNPNNGNFTVITNNLTWNRLEVFNMNGKLIYSNRIYGTVLPVNLGEVQEGVYFVKALSKGDKYYKTAKLIIDK